MRKQPAADYWARIGKSFIWERLKVAVTIALAADGHFPVFFGCRSITRQMPLMSEPLQKVRAFVAIHLPLGLRAANARMSGPRNSRIIRARRALSFCSEVRLRRNRETSVVNSRPLARHKRTARATRSSFRTNCAQSIRRPASTAGSSARLSKTSPKVSDSSPDS